MTIVDVKPGICGFTCLVQTSKKAPEAVDARVECDCDKISEFSNKLKEVKMQALYKRPFNENAVYQKAGECRLHSSCPVPCAIIKTL